MAETILQVVDVFTIRGRGVVVVGRRAEQEDAPITRIGDAVAVVRADGTRLRTTLRSFQLLHNPPLGEWFAISLGPEIRREDVAPGDGVIRVDGSGDPG